MKEHAPIIEECEAAGRWTIYLIPSFLFLCLP